MKLSAALVLLGAAPFAASLANADTSYANSVRLGAYLVYYHVSADDISGSYVVPGLNANLKNVQTVYFGYVRSFTPHWSVELTLGWPPKTDTLGRGPATVGSVPYNGQVLSTAKWFAPTVLAEYTFKDESARWRPFVGLGVNYTRLYDRQSTAAGNAAFGGPTAVSTTASFGPALTAGISYRIADHWFAYASASASAVKTDLTANTAGVLRRTHVDFGPQTLVVSLGYSF